MYRHGLRVSEAVALRWEAVDLNQGLLHVNRLKNGVASTHPLRGSELRALRRLKREYPDNSCLFVTERQGPLTTSTVRKLIARAGWEAGIAFSVHPHMLWHSTGYKLANGPADTRDGTIGNLSASISPAASTFNTLDAVGEAKLPNGLLALFSF
jgi:type 1 fimbriae regulatory protein FimE